MNEETRMSNTTFTSHHIIDFASKRIYITQLEKGELPQFIAYVENIAKEENLTKIIAKVSAQESVYFIEEGYAIEAYIPHYFKGKTDAIFVSKYFNAERKKVETLTLQEFQQLFATAPKPCAYKLDDAYCIVELSEKEIPEMIAVFKEVFETYPFPIFDAHFLAQSMNAGNRYFGVFTTQQKLVAVSAAECDEMKENAEMTDFAIVSAHRGKGLAYHLLRNMEQALKEKKYKTLYTIARLHSIAMNKTFYNEHYQYSGTLTNNTQIAGNIESMNVWYKHL